MRFSLCFFPSQLQHLEVPKAILLSLAIIALGAFGFMFPTLIFVSLLFLEKGNHQKKTRIFYSCRTPEILGKEEKNGQKGKEFLAKEKSKEIRKGKEKKIRANTIIA